MAMLLAHHSPIVKNQGRPKSSSVRLRGPVGLPDCNNLIRFHVRNRLPGSARPTNLEICARRIAQPKMQALVVAGVEARLRNHFLRLSFVAIRADQPRTYPCAG